MNLKKTVILTSIASAVLFSATTYASFQFHNKVPYSHVIPKCDNPDFKGTATCNPGTDDCPSDAKVAWMLIVKAIPNLDDDENHTGVCKFYNNGAYVGEAHITIPKGSLPTKGRIDSITLASNSYHVEVSPAPNPNGAFNTDVIVTVSK